MNSRVDTSFVKTVLRASTTQQKIGFAILFGSAIYVALAFGPVVFDKQAGGMRFVAAFCILFQLRMNLYLGALLYRRFLTTSFYDFYDTAERAGREAAFMLSLSPIVGEMLYEQTLPRVGFLGLMYAREKAGGVAA